MESPTDPTPTPASGTERTAAPEGRVRWRRFAVMMVPSAAAAGALLVLTAQGVMAAQFSISGMPFTVTADKLTGQGFEQYGALDNMADNSPNAGDTGGQELVAVSAIRSAKLTNLCQSVNLGGINLKITAGRGSTPVSATTLVVDSTVLTGDASFGNIQIGQDSSTLNEVPGVQGPLGGFGQQSDTVTINHLRQTNYATTAAKFTLPGLHLGFSGHGC
jgi:hypothetical protein